MQILERGEKNVTALLTRDELLMLNNALNELCHLLPVQPEEVEALLGASFAEASRLLDEVGAAYDALPR